MLRGAARTGRTSRVAGSGIGLFVAHRLVESIGGTIWARPREDGPGAEFGFRLMRKVVATVADRLRATRLQLLDVYAKRGGAGQ